MPRMPRVPQRRHRFAVCLSRIALLLLCGCVPLWFAPVAVAASAAPSEGEAPAVDPITVVSSPLEPALFALATFGVALLSIGIVACLYRMLKGPHLADRVLAADTLALHVVALVVVLELRYETAMFFDAALVVAILGFASTVAFSQYIYANRGKTEETASPDAPAADAMGPNPSDANPPAAGMEGSP